jgi:arylsulfatase A-like enzyme
VVISSRVALVALAAALAGCSRPGPRRHNVVLVSLDTLRADHVGAYGYSRPTSPHIDALARAGVVFDLAISQAVSTHPSHRSLFQSRYASHTGDNFPMLAEVLRGRGYRTAAFTGGGNVSARLGFARGFEIYREDGTRFVETFPAFEAWLAQQRDAPFFAFLHTYDVHLPYDPPAPYDTMFLPDYKGPVTGKETLTICRKLRHLLEYEHFEGEVPLTDGDRRKVVALYDGAIRYLDGFIGRLVALLEQRRLLDHTVLVLLSDHGEEFWDHGSVLHSHTLYQELLHVPLIWRLPGGQFAGRRVPALIRNMDVAPTILDLVGISPQPTFQGRSLFPLMRGDATAAMSGIAEMQTARTLLDPPWKLVLEDGDQARLFHLTADPGEHRDLAKQEPARTAAMRLALGKALASGTAEVRELVPGTTDEALKERLRALGYVE